MAVHDPEPSQTPFIKNLASSNAKLCSQSLAALQAYLSTRTRLTDIEAARLWTGLFWALWMADGAPRQAKLAHELADLVFPLARPEHAVHEAQDSALSHDAATPARRTAATPPPKDAARHDSQSPDPSSHDVATTWLRAGWSVLSTNWSRIDALRIDKFLLLARRLLAAHLGLLLHRLHPPLIHVLRSHVLDVADETCVALGLRLHILDIWVDELARIGALDPSSSAHVLHQDDHGHWSGLARVVADAVDELASSPVKSVRVRAEESSRDDRLPWLGVETVMDDGDNGWDGFED
ncbi:hypothetical protein CDD82_1723 [Ophiocordyceps australis]|uniref:Uncharacterized protein n=1 Tax=Ophiocordyceps australis TaxID=1399860 RepID=A0A2C5YB71_9HYPO|nr:hypothetical protein CDD82_1723 [Ophiocordyceps australis]